MRLILEGGDITFEKLDKLFSEYFRTLKVPAAWKNASIVLFHKKGNTKDRKNCGPISLVSVV